MQNENSIDQIKAFIEPELLLNDILNFGPLGIAIFDNEKNNFAYVNSRMEKLFGATKEHILASAPLDFVPEFQPDGSPSLELVTSNHKRVLSGEKLSFTWQQRRVDGELFFTSVTAHLIESSNKKYSIAIHSDITEEVRSNKKTKSILEKYKLILDNAFDGIVLFDGDKKVPLDCNQRLLDHLGVTKEEYLNSPYSDFSAPIQMGGICYTEKRKIILKEISKKGHHRYEWIHLAKSGKKLYSEVSTVKLSEPDSHLRLSIIKDITDEQETIHQLSQTQQYLLEAQSAARLASFQYNIDKDELIWSNYAYETLNIDPDSAPKNFSFFLDFIYEDDRELFVEKLFQAKNNNESVQSELRFLNANKDIVYAHFRAAPLQSGDHQVFLGSVQDISAIKSAELNFIDSAEKYKDLFDNMHDAFLIVNKNGSFGITNQSAQKLLGYTSEELASITIPDIVHPEDAEKSKKYIEKLIKDGYYEDYTGRIVRKDGSVRYLQVNSNAILKDGKFVGSRDIARDVTALKEAEAKREELFYRLKKANDELKTFAHVVSHDLKAPLRAISSLSKWIKEDYADSIDEEGKNKLDLLHNRVNRMHNFINAILEYSKAGESTGRAYDFELGTIVNNIIDLLAPPENIEIQIKNPLPRFTGVPSRIGQVFQNIISNAIQYNDKDLGKIVIDWKKEMNFYIFSISDNGPGIPEKDFEKIFRIFKTLQVRDDYESTGIGLTIVKRIVENYQGTISVESEVGKGSTFTFSLRGIEN